MSDMLTGSVSLNKFSGMSPMQDFMKSYNNSLKDLGELNDSLNPNSSNLANDPELKNDLKLLLNNQSVGNIDGINGDLSADKAAKTFSNVFNNYINEVNSTQKTAEKAVTTLASGGNIDLHTVMIASEKASLGMQLTMQMRNKILQAYQEVSRMNI